MPEVESLAQLATGLNSALDSLEAALAKLQGPVNSPGSPRKPASPTPQPPGAAAPSTPSATTRVLEFSASDHASTPDTGPSLIDTPTIHEHLRRLYVYFCSSPTATESRDVAARMPMLSTYGFTKLARATQLIGDRCSPVDVDLVFCKVVKTRAAKMSLGDMIRGLAILALRLYPAHATQADALHQLLSDHLLPWMLQLEAALVEVQLGAQPLGLLFERHAPFTQQVFDVYLNTPAHPISTAVAALPLVLMQWPQLVAFAQDFELCPALVPWQQLARQFCFVGTCAVPEQWQRPEAHGLTAAQFAALLGWCALEAPMPNTLRAPEPPPCARGDGASPHAGAALKLKALFAHLQLSRGAHVMREQAEVGAGA